MDIYLAGNRADSCRRLIIIINLFTRSDYEKLFSTFYLTCSSSLALLVLYVYIARCLVVLLTPSLSRRGYVALRPSKGPIGNTENPQYAAQDAVYGQGLRLEM